jgi:hypothetical protein
MDMGLFMRNEFQMVQPVSGRIYFSPTSTHNPWQDTRSFYLSFLQTVVAGGFRTLRPSEYGIKTIQAHRGIPYTMGDTCSSAGFGLISLGAQITSAATTQ